MNERIRELADQVLPNEKEFHQGDPKDWGYFFSGDELEKFAELIVKAEPVQEPITRLFGTLPVHDAQQAEPEEQMPVGWLESPHGAFRADPLYKMQFPSQILQWQIALYTAPPQRKQAEPVAWSGYDLDGMLEAFSRVIEAHHTSKHPFHDPIDTDARTALRILRGIIPAMKAVEETK